MTEGTAAFSDDWVGLDKLVSAWGAVNSAGPYVLPGDMSVLEAWPELMVSHDSFSAYCNDALFGRDDHDQRLHLGLVPMPYVGNLKKATVFVLMQNPGPTAVDYYAEEHAPDYKARLLANLRQGEPDFLFLDPRVSWTSTGKYWLDRFRGVAKKLASDVGTFREALSSLAKSVAVLEVVPYYSPAFGLPDRLVDQLESVRLMKDFVKRDLAPRALQGEVLLIVTRQVKRWGLEASENVVLYESASEARGAHISPATRGGEAILRFLGSSKLMERMESRTSVTIIPEAAPEVGERIAPQSHNDQGLMLVGALPKQEAASYLEELVGRVQRDGRAADWWSYPLNDQHIEALEKSEHLYLYAGKPVQKLTYRFHVIDHRTLAGNAGMECPWPLYADENLRGVTRTSLPKSQVFKTWFLIDRVEQLDQPKPLALLEGYDGRTANPSALLNAFAVWRVHRGEGAARPRAEPD